MRTLRHLALVIGTVDRVERVCTGRPAASRYGR